MKQSSLSLAAALSLLCSSPLQAAPPELKTSGNQIVVKATGKPVRLCGANIPSLDWGLNDEGIGGSIVNSLIELYDNWGVNVVRLPVNRIVDGVDGWVAGHSYRGYVEAVVTAASARGMYVILDLHEYVHPYTTSQSFWSARAGETFFKNNPAVLFGLCNEPHDITWTQWRDGDATAGYPGMQDLLDAIRAAGANNIVTASGLDWAYDITGPTEATPYTLTDTGSGNGIVYETHIYPWKTQWTWKVGRTANTYPVIVGEWGHPDGTTFNGQTFEDDSTWTPRSMDFIDSHRLHYTAWSFHPTARPNMITSWTDLTPTPWMGVEVKSRMLKNTDPLGEKMVGGKVIGTAGINGDATQPVTHSQKGACVPYGGNTSYYYDAVSASNCWTGLDLMEQHRITKIQFYPRSGYAGRMQNGVFQGSNVADFSTATTLHTVSTVPPDGTLTTATISNTGSFRYVRYLGPANAYCNVTQIKFFGKTAILLEGEDVTPVMSSGDLQSDVVDALGSAGKWSKLDLNSSTGTDFGEYTFQVPATATYTISVRGKYYTDRGRYTLKIDGTTLGSEVDQYYNGTLYTEATIGSRSLTAGSHTFRFTCTSKNTASTNYDFSIDYIKLQP